MSANATHGEARIAMEMGLQLGVRLRSKKNKVYVASRDAATLILKVYDPEFASRSTTEFSVLTKASQAGLAVPRPVDFREGQALVMEYIHGHNLCDLVNDMPGPDVEALARMPGLAQTAATRTIESTMRAMPVELARWFAGFHKATGMLRGDSILRNFVVGSPEGADSEDRLFGVDFEEAHPGDPSIDIGEMVSSLLNTDPMFAPNKISFCEEFIASYIKMSGHTDVHQVICAAVSSLRTAAARRPRQRDRLLEEARVLEDKGFRGLKERHGEQSGK
ncbi:MAG TPA: hypothetical protein GXX23_04450 [Firmicutes bacterium]|nr:hypothetical protein [Candidatus Fermentithermobacillaceae bacterium]